MNGAEFRCKREYLGLSAAWIADKLGVDTRSVQRWETMKTIPPRAREAIEYLYASAARSVSIIAVNELKKHDQRRKAGEGMPPLVIPAGENQLPASWHRMIAVRVAERTGQEITAA
jgi:hypothetical protein